MTGKRKKRSCTIVAYLRLGATYTTTLLFHGEEFSRGGGGIKGGGRGDRERKRKFARKVLSA